MQRSLSRRARNLREKIIRAAPSLNGRLTVATLDGNWGYAVEVWENFPSGPTAVATIKIRRRNLNIKGLISQVLLLA